MSVTTATRDQRLPVRLFNGLIGVRDRPGLQRAGFTVSIDDMHDRFATYPDHFSIKRETLP